MTHKPLLLTLALFATLPAFAQDHDYRNFAGDYGAQPVAIKPNRAIVRFKKGVASDRQAATMRRESLVDPAVAVEDTANPETKIVPFIKGISPAEADAAILRLKQDEHVESASPIISMVEGGGLEAATSEHFYMSFETPVAEKELYGILEKEGVAVEESKEYTKIKRKGFWLKCTEAATLHGLAMSNRLYGLFNEKGSPVKPINAGAEFVSLYPTLASSTPNDKYYNDQPDFSPDPYDPPTQPLPCEVPRPASTVADTYACQQNLNAISVPDAWDITKGSPYITVAVIDTGVDMNYGPGPYYDKDGQQPGVGGDGTGTVDYSGHTELNPNQWHNYGDPIGDSDGLPDLDGVGNLDDDNNGFDDDFYGWDFIGSGAVAGALPDNIPYGDHISLLQYPISHGTAVAGVIAARGNNSAGIAGIAGGWGTADGVKIMPIRAFIPKPDEPYGCISSVQDLDKVAQGINYAVDNGANVISMSLGNWELTTSLYEAVINAHANDVVVVAAAHNYDNAVNPSGPELPGPTWPARMKEVICVGGLNWRQEPDGDGAGIVPGAIDDGDNNETVQRKFGSHTYGVDSAPGTGSANWGFDIDNPNAAINGIFGGACAKFDPASGTNCVCSLQLSAFGSDFGKSLDIMAPCLEIFTTDNSGADGDKPGDYRVPASAGDSAFNKTSSATPHVAGVAALLLSATLDMSATPPRPTLTPTQVQAILCLSADDLHYTRNAGVPINAPGEPPIFEDADGDGYADSMDEVAEPGRDIYTGWGRVNAKAAIDLARAPRMEFQDSNGRHAASFDHLGNLVTEWAFIKQNPLCPFSTFPGEFVLQDSAGATIFKITNVGGIETYGGLYTQVPSGTNGLNHDGGVDLDDDVPGDNFVIQNEFGDGVAVITTETFTNTLIDNNPIPVGSVLLRGRYFSGWDPDGTGYFIGNCGH